MKVILQQDVKGQGKKGQMIEASDGYARNFLLPRKLAVPATAENVNTIPKTKIVQDEPIKAFGGYELKVKLGYEVTGTLKVVVAEA